MLADLVGHEGNPPLDGKGCKEACLAARVRRTGRASARAAPRHPRRPRRRGRGRAAASPRPAPRRGRRGPQRWSRGHPRAGSPRRAEPRALGTGVLELVERDEPGTRDERHLRRGVVALEERGQRLLDVGRPCGSVSDERSPQGLGDPDGMRGAQGEALDGVADTLGDEVGPRVRLPLADASHDGVDETGRPGAVDLSGQGHGLVDRRVAGHPHAEQLVRAEPQGVEHVGIDLVDGATCSGRDDRVVEAGEPRRAVDQLGGESGVAAADSACRATASATRGWRRRRRRSHASRCRPRVAAHRCDGPARTVAAPNGVGPSAHVPVAADALPRARRPTPRLPPRRSSLIADPLSCLDARATSPVRGRHRLLAVCLHRAQHAPGAVPVPTKTAFFVTTRSPGPERPSGPAGRRRRRRRHRADLEPLAAERGPRTGRRGAAPHEPVDRGRRAGPHDAGVVHLDLRGERDALGRLRHGHEVARLEPVEGGDEQAGAGARRAGRAGRRPCRSGGSSRS